MGIELGTYLRARRASVDPGQVGLARNGIRKVSGLRREEVAVLAAVSVDYYARLEQGRERRPSRPVLHAIADALRLDDEAREHLFGLAGLSAPARDFREPLAAAPELLQLIEAWAHTPALVLTPVLDVLGANALARALFAGLEITDNLARAVFLDPDAERFYPQWDRVAASTVAALRTAEVSDPASPRLEELVEELGGASDTFTALWAQHVARGKRHEVKRFDHPDVGVIELSYQTFDIQGSPRQSLVVYQAEPKSTSEQRLSLLGSLAASRDDEGRDRITGSSRAD